VVATQHIAHPCYRNGKILVPDADGDEIGHAALSFGGGNRVLAAFV
jgi:hypothetical protein